MSKYARITDEQFLEAAAKSTSQVDLAEKLGVPSGSITGLLRRRKLTDKVEALLRDRHEIPEPEEREERIKTVQLEESLKLAKKSLAEYEREFASREEFYEKMREICRVPVDIPKLKTARQDTKRPRESAIVSVYDQQYGQLVRSFDTPGGKGAFGAQVFDKRQERFVKGVTGILRARAAFYNLQELWIVFGGDQVEGDEVFAGQAWQLELNPVEQVYTLQAKNAAMVEALVRFAKEEVGIPRVGIVYVDGNHGAVGGKRGGARPANYNWDHLHHLLVRDRLEHLPIDLQAVEHDSVFFRAQGHEFQAIHGQEIRGWGGLPFYGLTRFDGRSIRYHNRIYRYLLMGHHHQQAEIPNGAGEHFVMGDWVGPNNLSRHMVAGSRPQQKVLFVSPRWGVTAREPVYFLEAEDAYAPTDVQELAA